MYRPQMIGERDCGAIGWMEISKGNRSTQRKPAPAPLCPPQTPLDQTRDQTLAAAVESQRLTAWTMALPPGFDPMSGRIGFILNNVTLMRVLCEYFSTSVNFNFNDCSIFINYQLYIASILTVVKSPTQRMKECERDNSKNLWFMDICSGVWSGRLIPEERSPVRMGQYVALNKNNHFLYRE
jgi:hypothetical protein